MCYTRNVEIKLKNKLYVKQTDTMMIDLHDKKHLNHSNKLKAIHS